MTALKYFLAITSMFLMAVGITAIPAGVTWWVCLLIMGFASLTYIVNNVALNNYIFALIMLGFLAITSTIML